MKRLAVGLVLLAALAGAARGGSPSGQPGKELVVFEAASLKDAFARLAEAFEKAHPGVKIVFNSAGSQELRTQIEHGASADVFASADRKQMDALAKAGLVTAPSILTCNEPVVVVTPAAAGTVKTFADLPRIERLVVGTPEVPIGEYTRAVLAKAAAKYGRAFAASVEARVVSRELSVRQVLAKVVLGEADAGIVYRSDAAAAKGKIVVVPIPPELNALAEYPIAPLAASKNAALARAWIDLALSPTGAAALHDLGFTSCSTARGTTP